MDGNNMPALHTAGRFDDLPRVADSMAAMAVRHPHNTLARRLEFEHRHPGVKISLPTVNPSGLWEADWEGRREDEPAGHDTCAGLLDYLEARFDRGDLRDAR